jgi:hypothetical protein
MHSTQGLLSLTSVKCRTRSGSMYPVFTLRRLYIIDPNLWKCQLWVSGTIWSHNAPRFQAIKIDCPVYRWYHLVVPFEPYKLSSSVPKVLKKPWLYMVHDVHCTSRWSTCLECSKFNSVYRSSSINLGLWGVREFHVRAFINPCVWVSAPINEHKY